MHDEHDEGEETTFGLAIGFRIFDDRGKLYLAEAEIAPYVDEPEELGVTLVFHPLEGMNPVEVNEDMDWPSWSVDFDDELNRDGSVSIQAQFTAIAEQLRDLSIDRLRDCLRAAQEEEEESN